MRRFGTPPQPFVQYRDRPGAYAAALRGRDILLTISGADRPGGGDLLFPGGGVDPGETLTQAVVRETFEETGWRVAAPVRIGAFQRYEHLTKYGMFARKVQHVFICRPVTQVCAPLEPDHTPVWMDARDAVRHLSAPGESEMLAMVLAKLGI